MARLEMVDDAGPAFARSSAWRTTNVGTRIFAARNLFMQDKLERVEEAGFPTITTSLAGLFHNLDEEGTRLTTLADRAWVTKQSMKELVERGVRQGFIERRPDLTDKRAKIICFTDKGRDLLAALRHGVKRAETRMAAHVGQAFLARMKPNLMKYCVAVGGPGHPELARSNSRWRKHNAGRVLMSSSDSFVRHVADLVAAAGHPGVSPGLLTFFRAMPLTGGRLTDLAADARITKSAMIEQVERAIGLGLAERHDLEPRPAKLIRLTPSGIDMLEEVHRCVLQAEDHMAEILSRDFVDELKRRLAAYTASSARAAPFTG